jgi:hypothetical protein
VNGRKILLEGGRKYRIIYHTPGTWNPRPMTPAEQRRYEQLTERLKTLHSGEEKQRVIQEIDAIRAETVRPGLVTNTFWVRPPGARVSDEPPDSEATVIDLRSR